MIQKKAYLILAGGKALPPCGIFRGPLLRALAAVIGVIVVAIGHGAVVADFACLGLIRQR